MLDLLEDVEIEPAAKTRRNDNLNISENLFKADLLFVVFDHNF